MMLKSWSVPPSSTSALTITESHPCMIGYWISCARIGRPLSSRSRKSSRTSICCSVTRLLSLMTSSKLIASNHSPLKTISAPFGSRILNACSWKLLAFAITWSWLNCGRVADLPLGSPIIAVKSPMIKTAKCPRSWKSRSFERAMLCPRWMSGAVGSTPSFTRSGRPSLSFASSSAGFRIFAQPRVRNSKSVMSGRAGINAVCSTTRAPRQSSSPF